VVHCCITGLFLLQSFKNAQTPLEELSAEQDNLRDSLNELKPSCKILFEKTGVRDFKVHQIKMSVSMGKVFRLEVDY